jgi:uncharacterized protein YndB with AHSA1/START domain
MLKKIALVLVGLIALLLIFAATRPGEFRVERRIDIKAPPDKIYPLLADFHRWAEWSPWENLDPAMKRTFSGAPADKGAIYEWKGNSQVGQGRMEVTSTTTPTRVIVKLDFIEPFEGHNTADFNITTPSGDTSTVTWAMYGPSPYISKLMGVFVSMDSMIGKDFENGLTKLKVAAEK